MPGEGSLAYNSGLFLDELPEFRRHVLAVLRWPIEKVASGYNLASLIDLVALAMIAAQIVTPSQLS
jgi:magnesium chelatase family protein